MTTLTKRERLVRTLKGDPVDRLPVACWRHWPGDDQDAALLADALVRDQEEFDWDFVKVSPSSSHTVTPWGARTVYRQPAPFGHLGERTYDQRVIATDDDWDGLKPLGGQPPEWARQVDVIRMLRSRLSDTPVLVSVFSPIAILRYLSGDDLFLTFLHSGSSRLSRVTGLIADALTDYVAALVEAGADGIFYSTLATPSVVTWRDYQDAFASPDRSILDPAAGLDLNILHLHGPQPYLQLAQRLPVAAANWDDRQTTPDLRDGLTQLPCGVVGGLAQGSSLLSGSPNDLEQEVHTLIANFPARVVVGPGCAMPVGVPRGNLHAVRNAVMTGLVVAADDHDRHGRRTDDEAQAMTEEADD